MRIDWIFRIGTFYENQIGPSAMLVPIQKLNLKG